MPGQTNARNGVRQLALAEEGRSMAGGLPPGHGSRTCSSILITAAPPLRHRRIGKRTRKAPISSGPPLENSLAIIPEKDSSPATPVQSPSAESHSSPHQSDTVSHPDKTSPPDSP